MYIKCLFFVLLIGSAAAQWNEIRIPSIVNDNYNYVEPYVCVRNDGNRILVAYIIDTIDKIGYTLLDQNLNQISIGEINVPSATDPSCAFDSYGNAYICYFRKYPAQICISKSTNGGISFNPLQVVIREATDDLTVDKPLMCIDDNPLSMYYNRIYIAYSVFSPIEGSTLNQSFIEFSYSNNQGESFSNPISISQITTRNPARMSYGAYPIINEEGNIFIFWFRSFPHTDYPDFPGRDNEFLSNKSSNGGQTFNQEISILSDFLFERPGRLTFAGLLPQEYRLKTDETGGHGFRVSPLPSVTISPTNGNIFLVANAIKTDEIYNGYLDYDISDNLIILKSTDNGESWINSSNITPLDPETHGRHDFFMPAISCNSNGDVLVFSYDSNVGAYNNITTTMTLFVSKDQGVTFHRKQMTNISDFDFGYGFIGDYIFSGLNSNYLYAVYNRPVLPTTWMKIYISKIPLQIECTLQNLDVELNNLDGSELILNGGWPPLTSPSYPQISHFNNITVEPRYTFYNPFKFYKWNIYNLRTSQLQKIASYNEKTFQTIFGETKPLTVRNYFEGGDGGTILFGEKDFNVINRISPYTENAFIYNLQGGVTATYKAIAEPTYNLFNTTWNFWRWEDGTTNTVREEPITQSSTPEWRANYKAQLRSDDQNGISSASQRKIVRTDNGRYHVVYESMGTAWYAHSATSDFYGAWYPDQMMLEKGKNPAIEYDGNILKVVCEEYDPQYGGNADIWVLTFEQSLQGGWYENTEAEVIASYPNSYYGNAKPVISYTAGEIFVAYRKNSTDGIKYMGRFYNNGNWGNWTTETDLTGTNSNCIRPAIIGEPGYIHIAYEDLYGIYYKFGYQQGSNSWRLDLPTRNLSSGSGFNYNTYPAISLSLNSISNKYVMVSWLGIYDTQHQSPMPKEKGGSVPQYREAAVVKVGYGSNWGTPSNFSNNVDYTNNGSLNTAYGSIIAWSESDGEFSKYVRRRSPTGYDPITSLSTNGIHTLVSNGSELGNIKAMVFNNSAEAPYLLNRCTNDFTYIPDGLGKLSEAGIIDISYGRSGIIEKNGIEFVFNIGDVLLNSETIKFIERADTLPVTSIEELNLSVRTDTLSLNSQSELIFSDYYYVVNGERADSLLSNDFNFNFKCELVKLSTGEVVGEFEEVNYNKSNLEEYGYQGYLVDCYGIEAGDYYLRLTSSVNEEVGLSLSDIQMDNVVLNKANLNIRNFKGENIPVEYSLEQNYPNPFNPTTTIRYQIPKDGMVTLKVYDILGAEVSTLVNDEKAAGKYEVNFNASSLASGVYIYRLSVNDFINVKKMVLVK